MSKFASFKHGNLFINCTFVIENTAKLIIQYTTKTEVGRRPVTAPSLNSVPNDLQALNIGRILHLTQICIAPNLDFVTNDLQSLKISIIFHLTQICIAPSLDFVTTDLHALNVRIFHLTQKCPHRMHWEMEFSY